MDITVPAPSCVWSRASCWTSLVGLWPFHLESCLEGEKRSTANWGFCTGKLRPWAAMPRAFHLVANYLWILAAETNYVIKKPEISVNGIFWRSLKETLVSFQKQILLTCTSRYDEGKYDLNILTGVCLQDILRPQNIVMCHRSTRIWEISR